MTCGAVPLPGLGRKAALGREPAPAAAATGAVAGKRTLTDVSNDVDAAPAAKRAKADPASPTEAGHSTAGQHYRLHALCVSHVGNDCLWGSNH